MTKALTPEWRAERDKLFRESAINYMVQCIAHVIDLAPDSNELRKYLAVLEASTTTAPREEVRAALTKLKRTKRLFTGYTPQGEINLAIRHALWWASCKRPANFMSCAMQRCTEAVYLHHEGKANCWAGAAGAQSKEYDWQDAVYEKCWENYRAKYWTRRAA